MNSWHLLEGGGSLSTPAPQDMITSHQNQITPISNFRCIVLDASHEQARLHRNSRPAPIASGESRAHFNQLPAYNSGARTRHQQKTQVNIRMDNLRRRCYVTTRSDLDNFLSVCFCSLSISFDLITRRGVGVMRTGAAPRIVFATQAENWATTRSDLEFFIQNIEIIFKSCSLTCVR